jgi:ATP-dependent RNA helicase RhlB
MKFTDFTLDSDLQEGLAEAGYITCMPVQEQVLQNGLDGSDLYVQSQTGTGKTAAYLVTILQRLSSDPALAGKKALIMVPTRELAVQVEEEAHILGACMKLKSASFYGGVGYGGQQDLLAKGVDVIVGTPGRVIDLQQSGTMKMNDVAFLVIDEADRMFDMGFYPDLRVLIKVLPPAEKRQTMLFSATLNATVKNLAWEYTVNAKEVTIEAENVTVTEIEQILYHVSSEDKMRLLLGILQSEKPDSLIIFCNTKRMSEVVAKRLKINGYEADFIIGDLPQAKRLQVIDSFKSKSLKCLVATDVAARGIDVNDLSMVINYDLPNEAENYVHRTGRTARAGKTGKAYTFCSEQDVYNLPAIEKYIEVKLQSSVASEDMMVADKSAHMYIRTDTYNNDYADDDRGRGTRRSSGPRSGNSSRSGSPSRAGSSSRGGSRPDSARGPGRPGEHGRARPDERGGAAAGRSGAAAGNAFAPDTRGRSDESRAQGSGDNRGRGPRPTGTERSARPGSDNRPRGAPIPQGSTRSQSGDYQENRNSGPDRDLSKLSFEERMAYYKNKYGSEEAARQARQADQRPSGNAGRQGEERRPTSGRPSQGKGREDPGTGGQNRQGAGRPNQGGRSDQQRPNRQGQGRNAPNASANQGKAAGGKQIAASAAPQEKAGNGVGFGAFLRRVFKKK